MVYYHCEGPRTKIRSVPSDEQMFETYEASYGFWQLTVYDSRGLTVLDIFLHLL
jgi:hypothetical protein